MANPIAIAAALARTVTIKCPYCGHKKLVDRRPRKLRVCPKCRRSFPDPISVRRKR
jgi:DNA-directed RNA polymerase subunit RPC12/RpoP